MEDSFTELEKYNWGLQHIMSAPVNTDCFKSDDPNFNVFRSESFQLSPMEDQTKKLGIL